MMFVCIIYAVSESSSSSLLSREQRVVEFTNTGPCDIHITKAAGKLKLAMVTERLE
jgi:hypothetical protein